VVSTSLTSSILNYSNLLQKGKVSIWDLDSKTKVDSIECGCKHVLCTRVAPEGGCAAIACQDGSVTLLDLATSKLRKRIEAHGKPARSLSFSADGKILISASDDGTIVSVFSSSLERYCCALFVHFDHLHSRLFTTFYRLPPLRA
jgi:WD40 repeat protein